MASARRHAVPQATGVRASDMDREQVVELLRDHYEAGRLSEDDLSERIESAYGARTVAELHQLLTDLPSPRAVRRHRRGGYETSVRIHFTTYLLVNLMLIGIWAASGGGYFWPIWPLLGWGIGLGCHAAPLLAGVGTRRVAHELGRPSTIDEVEAGARSERLSLRAAAALDGTVTILFSD